jgi:bifunctional non-homologous end joining protein LigD
MVRQGDLTPMLLSAVARPPTDDGGWAYEVKWDGFRVLVRVAESSVEVSSRRGTDFTQAFPELDGLSAALGGRSAVFDGELVCFNPEGRTSFGRVRRRWAPAARRQATRLAKECPATLVIFDVLRLDGELLIGRSYEERRADLAGLRLGDRHWLVTDYHVGNGEELVRASRELRLEGIVAKRLASRYRPGQRSGDWLKIKNYLRETFVVGGWLADPGGWLEALLVGRRSEAGVVYCGTVEFGLNGQRRALRELLEVIPAHESPFDGGGVTGRRARYVQPRLAVSVRFIGWDGTILREAIFERVTLLESFWPQRPDGLCPRAC